MFSHRPKFICTLILCVLGIYGPLFPQSNADSIEFRKISEDIFQASPTQIFEDYEGFLWIGTQNGVFRFNGTSFKAFKTGDENALGLTDGYVTEIYEDHLQNLYFGTLNGLNIYDRRLDIVKPYPFKKQSTFLQGKYIKGIVNTGKYLWMGTRENGLYRYNEETGETNEIILSQLGNKENINAVFKNAQNENLLVVAQHAIYAIKPTGVVEQLYKTNETIGSAKLAFNSSLYAGTWSGSLITLQLNNDFELLNAKSESVCLGHSILAIETDELGQLWLGSENAGVWIRHREKDGFHNYKADFKTEKSISGNSIWSLHKGTKNVMWLGIFQKGLNFVDPNFFKFTSISQNYFNENSLNNNIVQCFYEDPNGNLYIGTDGGGLNYWDRNKNSFSHFSLKENTLHTNVVLAIHGRENGELWLGSWANGLGIFNSKTGKYQALNSQNSFLASNNVFSVTEDQKNRIWIGTLHGGIQLYDPLSKAHKTFSLEHSNGKGLVTTIARILVDSKNHVWVGSQTDGLFKLIEKEQDKWTIEHYWKNGNKEISNDYVNAIFQDSKENIWVGTASGLNRYLPNEDAFEHIQLELLKNEAVKGIVEDENGYLWLSTDQGILRFDVATNRVLRYDKSDGLQDDKFNKSSAYRTMQNEILFGGSNGFNIFKTTQAKKSGYEEKLLLTGLRIFNKKVLPDDEHEILNRTIRETDSIVLDHHHSVFNIEFNTLTYSHPEKINFAFYLDGFESEWNFVGNTKSATYTNLDPGNYTFRLRATNTDGIWGTNEKQLHVTILPPFWQTWWFKMLVGLAIVLSVYLAYYMRVRNMKRYQIKLEKTIGIRTQELNQEKQKLSEAASELKNKNEEIQKFAYSISHDLKGPLSGIQGLMDVISIETANIDVPNLKKYLNMIGTSCETMHGLIEDITKVAKLGEVANKMEVLDMNEVMTLAHNFVHGKQSVGNIEIRIVKNLPSIKGDKNRMIQIFSNLMDNAIKYMGDQEHPTVLVETNESNERIEFIVIDNGSGMDEKSIQKLFAPFERFHPKVKGTGLGLYMVKKIVESHNGSIRAESEGVGKGTSFIVSFPKIEKNLPKNRIKKSNQFAKVD
ncbi:sensor histidine kinase [Croceivirga thetidis]|uniref:histidine kinase n=1 Tax=Croceivirga thetidis TaxID=2721623 RepID=A0ABX1GRN9_9FLAO|nr:sensor histidine kinase [Croceivirga thetidis]NKI32264.1 GHKL domain-containing protein [Croceivirga thetidis]